MAEARREHGTVKRVYDKGYGFIEPDENPPLPNERGQVGIFFHCSDLLTGHFDELAPGRRVSFVRAQLQEGLRGVEVIEDGREVVPAAERVRARRR